VKLWAIWPEQANEDDALTAYTEAVVEHGVNPVEIFASGERYSDWCVENPDRRVMHLNNWIRKCRWRDKLARSGLVTIDGKTGELIPAPRPQQQHQQQERAGPHDHVWERYGVGPKR
jgi:hypothetical protein